MYCLPAREALSLREGHRREVVLREALFALRDRLVHRRVWNTDPQEEGLVVVRSRREVLVGGIADNHSRILNGRGSVDATAGPEDARPGLGWDVD